MQAYNAPRNHVFHLPGFFKEKTHHTSDLFHLQHELLPSAYSLLQNFNFFKSNSLQTLFLFQKKNKEKMERKRQAENATLLFALGHSLTALVETSNLTSNGFCNQDALCCIVVWPLSNKII